MVALITKIFIAYQILELLHFDFNFEKYPYRSWGRYNSISKILQKLQKSLIYYYTQDQSSSAKAWKFDTSFAKKSYKCIFIYFHQWFIGSSFDTLKIAREKSYWLVVLLYFDIIMFQVSIVTQIKNSISFRLYVLSLDSLNIFKISSWTVNFILVWLYRTIIQSFKC